MAKLVHQPPTRYSAEQWHTSNATQFATAEAERAIAERRRAEAERLMSETDRRRERTQNDVGQKLSQRITDLQHWREEVQRQQDDTQEETRLAEEMKGKLECALNEILYPVDVTKTCLRNREKREGIDLVHDAVEIELLKERDIQGGVQALLKRNVQQVTEQIRLLNSRSYHLGKDLSDKQTAINIDGACSQLDNDSRNIALYQGAVTIDAKSVAPSDWASFSDNNISAAERERHASAKLRAVADDVLSQAANDLNTQRRAVNEAFQRRIGELEEAKETLEMHLEKVNEEYTAMDENAAALAAAIEAKMPPMKVSHTRLAHRSQRPNVELVRDPVQYRLVGEVAELQDSIERLQVAYSDAMSSLEGLRRRRLDLEEDIRIKTLSLNIDKNQCMGIRQNLSDVWKD